MGELEPEYWRNKKLQEMSVAEWEALCDGCGRCCLVKLEDIDTEELHYTDVACRLFDAETCRCADYANRLNRVPDCVGLTPRTLEKIEWLPPTCAYKLLFDGKDLYWWHPLISGTFETVLRAGVSVRGRTVSELVVGDDELEDRCVSWPAMLPDRS
jgi:hypothetical protein